MGIIIKRYNNINKEKMKLNVKNYNYKEYHVKSQDRRQLTPTTKEKMEIKRE